MKGVKMAASELSAIGGAAGRIKSFICIVKHLSLVPRVFKLNMACPMSTFHYLH